MDSRHGTKRVCGLAVAALVALGQSAAQVSAEARAACGRTGLGSEHEAIIAELSAFYRDLRSRQWAAVLDHFWPAKITARWEPPVADPAWEHSPPRAMATTDDASTCACPIEDENGAPASTEIHVVAAWARVLVSPCRRQSGGPNGEDVQELWLLQVSGRWKIVHLVSRPPGAVSWPRRYEGP